MCRVKECVEQKFVVFGTLVELKSHEVRGCYRHFGHPTASRVLYACISRFHI